MKKTDININYNKKLKILEIAKTIVRTDGWSQNIIKKLIKNKNISSTELTLLFPNGYRDLLRFSLKVINNTLERNIKKINIINFSLTKRIKKILLMRLEILNKDKIFYKKTFNHLLLPQNSKIMKINLYNTIDEMWYLAGDNSTDFSFYTKRLTLGAIYVNALFIFFNKSYEEAETNINKNLERISKIPKIKDRFSLLKDNLPIFLRGFFN